jgi:putative cell wall-binding protein
MMLRFKSIDRILKAFKKVSSQSKISIHSPVSDLLSTESKENQEDKNKRYEKKEYEKRIFEGYPILFFSPEMV